MPPDEPDVSPFSGLLGVEWLSHEPEDARARIEVRDDLKQPYGYLHGGVISSVIDEMCSRCTVIQVLNEGMVALAQTLDVAVNRTALPAGCGEAGLGLRIAPEQLGPGVTTLDVRLSCPSELWAVTVNE